MTSAVISLHGIADGMSVIARTAAIGRSPEELEWDLNYLMQLWTAVEGASADTAAMIVALKSRRKRKTMMTASAAPSNSVLIAAS